MSDSVCSILLVACIDVCAGFCLDFTSLRHAFTESPCNCRCCTCCRRDEDGDGDDDEEAATGEGEPLIKPLPPPVNGTGMPPQPPMQVTR
ncbi:hypothetical protein DFH08DRAFT_970660 [Mycena albidolilacea]|uniref:Secreted protein n=1 Tax=Mycena albidolilacea TaxID=1033008 RepID=A0AAD6ZFV0_9AGAR|nr:hypothetical protein DFH08DRAFT_970660 [Mycena albidolilacea]